MNESLGLDGPAVSKSGEMDVMQLKLLSLLLCVGDSLLLMLRHGHEFLHFE